MLVLILRSAHAEDVRQTSNARARVSKDEERAIGFALMLRDASQRIWALEAPALLSMRAGATHQPAAVQNERRLRFIVCGLLFTMTFATRTCRLALSAQDFPKATFAQTWPWSRRHIRPGPTWSSISRGASPSHRAAVCWCVPTDACDESCATAATPTQIISRGCAQQLCIPGGRLASIVAADAKSYDSGVT
jgi:hypothetical protein